MGRAYHYPPGSRAALEARAAEHGVPIRVTESDDAIEVLIDDGPWVLSWERNQPVSATLVEPVPDGAASRLVVPVSADTYRALLTASNDTLRREALTRLQTEDAERVRTVEDTTTRTAL